MLTFVYSSIALGIALFCLYITTKVSNHFWQLLSIVVAIFWLCSSLFYSLVPLELLLAIALVYLTPKIHFWHRLK
ncbi:hypothetical protein NIES22_65310 [Calothrix brevissima NIES-22]|nr:hypothetical protein NIES22_65310 [Calothrix brevissima NIES-22]